MSSSSAARAGDRATARWPLAALLPSPAELLRLPLGLVRRTRWLLCACALTSMALTLAGALAGSTPVAALLLVGTTAVLTGSWLYRYRSGRATGAADAVELLAVLLFAAACPQPAYAFGVAFPAMWYRSVHGTSRRIAVHALGMVLALALAVSLWSTVPGHSGAPMAAQVLGTLPVLLLNALVFRHLAWSLFHREADRERDAALTALGSKLLGVTDRQEVLRLAWEATEAVCRATPGLRTAALDVTGDELRVIGCAGGFRATPAPLPGALLPPGLLPDEPVQIDPPADLVRTSGVRGEWLVLPLPDEPGVHMLLGAGPSVPREAVVATRSILNQVTLALRASEAHRELRDQALTDGLTGLANRTAFSAALASALTDPATETWVLFLDLDDFKVVNDGLGHLAGDRLLAHLGGTLSSALRSGDLCARLGGDEFAVLLRGATEDDARQVGRRVVELVSTPVHLREGVARIGASVGATQVRPGMSETSVVHQADLAMYAAKSAGKNRLQFFSPGLLQLDDQVAAEAELRAAVDAGELVLAYQPVLAADDGRCTAVEALVRWAHPERGLLAPDAFLPLAERTGVIVALGERVLQVACADATRWADPAHPVDLHVNVSPLQLVHPHFVDQVRAALAASGLPPERLVLEVTESTVLDSPVIAATLTELVGLGIGIAVDDFGTGYSALTTLRTLPISIVKIDKSFVAGALVHAADQAVVEAIVQMAARLGLQTVAEGVESVEQQQFLEQAGITAVQGFLHLAPAPLPAFTDWLVANRRRTAAGLPART